MILMLFYMLLFALALLLAVTYMISYITRTNYGAAIAEMRAAAAAVMMSVHCMTSFTARMLASIAAK